MYIISSPWSQEADEGKIEKFSFLRGVQYNVLAVPRAGAGTHSTKHGVQSSPRPADDRSWLQAADGGVPPARMNTHHTDHIYTVCTQPKKKIVNRKKKKEGVSLVSFSCCVAL